MTSHQKATFGLAGLWLIVQLTMVALFGIGHGGDTGRYLGSVPGLLHGELPAGKSASYVGYDLFITAFMATPLQEAGIIAGQLVLSALAAFYTYKLGKYLYSRRAGYIAALFYIGFLKLHPWNVYILTDSLFISLIIIATYCLLTARTTKQFVLASAVVLFTATVRPDGIAVALAAGVWAIYKLYTARKYAWLFGLLLLVTLALPLGWQAVTKTSHDEELLRHYEVGAVIWNYPPLYFKVPGVVPDYVHQISNPFVALLAFIKEKPLFFTELALTKVWYEVIHVRPFHAPLHNFLIVVTLVPIYWLAYVGWRHTTTTNAKVFIMGLLVFKALIVAFTFADWSGRFLLHIMPLLLLLAAGAVEKLPYDFLRRA